jgi:hypothetical protein
MMAAKSVHEQIKNNDDLAFIGFTIKIKDYGEGITKEGIDKLFVDF